MKNTSSYTLDFQQIDKTMIAAVGGKGANLGELTKIEGVKVPEGFCVCTEAFEEVISNTPLIDELIKQLSLINIEDRTKISVLSSKIRQLIEKSTIPQNIFEEIDHRLSKFDEKTAFAVRSSATAEDLPTASFAGQQDTYLNIIGRNSVINHISRCQASLFTERAVIYRLQNGFDHRKVSLSVIVQKMIFPQAAGILFTADPVTSNRKVLSIDAGFGLGEAMVSGLVNADNYKVYNGKITDKKISAKKLAVYALKNGGTTERKIEPEYQNRQVLADEQILELERIGRKIEKHFGSPQDIEWCLADNEFFIVQSRPITTLFPIPEANDDENHVYVSVGHQQMMTDAMKPLGLSVWNLTAVHPMAVAGGRLFVDVTQMLASSGGRNTLLNVLGKSDPIMKAAFMTIIDRGDFIKFLPEDDQPEQIEDANKKGATARDFQTLKDYDPTVVDDLIKRDEKSLRELKDSISTKTGTELFDFILKDFQQRKNLSDPQSFGVIMTGMNAAHWINERMNEWLGEKNAADKIAQSVPNNVTSEMGLALLDVADAIRPFPRIIDYLQTVKNDDFLDEIVRFDGGQEVRDAFSAFLDKYGMRCAGEIDITRTRWSEKPLTLVPIILSNIKNFEFDAGKRKFEQGRAEALKKETELLTRLRQLPDGEQKAGETKRMIDLVRNFAGYREYPKYGIVRRYFVYKQALMNEAERLVQSKVIHEKEDIYFLTFEELREAVSEKKADYQIINRRKDDFKFYEKLTPPRVITSDGEIIEGEYKRKNLPPGAIVGLAVSSGVIEGRARVILNMEDADLKDGDILVTRFTDPSWTPLFVSVKGLVTEVGGLMTHGAVIAREYGLPAVVGVDNAANLIQDGQRIRVNGTEGFVEIL